MLSEAICSRLYYCRANIHSPFPSCMGEVLFPTLLMVGFVSFTPAICHEKNIPLAAPVLSDWVLSEKAGGQLNPTHSLEQNSRVLCRFKTVKKYQLLPITEIIAYFCVALLQLRMTNTILKTMANTLGEVISF